MSFPFQREMDFFFSIMKKMRMPVHLIRQDADENEADDSLRAMLHLKQEDVFPAKAMMKRNQPGTIYRVVDSFLRHYITFHLPAPSADAWVVLGPYLTVDPSEETLMEMAEGMGLPMGFVPQLTDYYASLPVFTDPSAIMAAVYSFGEVIWKNGENMDVVDINNEEESLSFSLTGEKPMDQVDLMQQMKQLEERYAYENELMETVSKGLINRAEVMMSSVSRLNYQQRLSDPLRNMKNYCIICNTLLRKAAQKGGVHPIHLDKISGQYARSIENAPSQDVCSTLIGDMIRAYCHLVRTKKAANYSGIVQKTVLYIESNLAGDLSLPLLAKSMKISPGYLSSQFHRETGQKLVEFIHEKRMKAAMDMLKNTHLQVQTVAQLTGFADSNYFGRQFKRYYGITPLQYRKSRLTLPGKKEE